MSDRREFEDELARACVEWADGRIGRGPWREPRDAESEAALLTRSPRIRRAWVQSESDYTSEQALREMEEDGYDTGVLATIFDSVVTSIEREDARTCRRAVDARVSLGDGLREEVEVLPDDEAADDTPEWDDESSWEEPGDDGIERPEE